MNIGYIRVSTQEQNTIRQEVLMESLGVDEVYIDRMSGKNTNRPELQKMMEYLCPLLHILVGIQNFAERLEVRPILHHIIPQP